MNSSISDGKYRGNEVTEWKECPVHGRVPSKYKDAYDYEWDIDECPLCTEQKKFEAKIQRAMIPNRFKEKSIENFSASDDFQISIKAKISKFIETLPNRLKSGSSLIFVGNVGTGKTHLAVSVAREAIKLGYTALFSSVSEIIRETRLSWTTSRQREVFEHFTSCDLLIIDEVGVQSGTDNERNILFDIINQRYMDVKSTIIISNEEPNVLKDFLGVRVIDRLSENDGQIIGFKGKSYRRQIK